MPRHADRPAITMPHRAEPTQRTAEPRQPQCRDSYRCRTARGVTLLEVVFATVVLALAVATMASTVSAISSQQGRSQHLLGAAELANRLVIQYLDDERSMPSEALTLSYGDAEYRFRVNITRVQSQLDESIERALDELPTEQTGPTPDRLKKIAVTVWLSEKSGGTYIPNQGAPQQTLVRIVDPLALHRRPPESVDNLLKSGAERILERLRGDDIEAEEE
jgi:type II secretory pathway pseudopilin PulG